MLVIIQLQDKKNLLSLLLGKVRVSVRNKNAEIVTYFKTVEQYVVDYGI